MPEALDRPIGATETRAPSATADVGPSNEPSFAPGRSAAAPGVFLMIESLQTGGSERQFTELARTLAAGPFHLHLGCVKCTGSFAEGLEDVPQFPLGGSLYGVQSVRTRWNLARHLRRLDVSVAHSFDFYTNLTMIPAARLGRVPVVIGSQRQIGDLLTPAQFHAQLAAFRWCDQVICNSRAAARELVTRGLPENKVTVIGNGLSAEAFAATAPALPVRPGVLRVGMIARMNARYKNHSGFLRAAAKVHARMPDVEFVLVGDGPLRPELEQQARDLGIIDKVIFLGDRRDVAAALAAVDLSVLPSNSESLSNVILESMAAGKPVIATRVGGNPEIVSTETGILVGPGDEQQLATARQTLLENRNLRLDFGRRARQIAESTFTTARMQQAHEELYVELLARKKRRLPAILIPPGTRPRTGRRVRVTVVAPSLRYVGGQSVQADLLLRHWQHDPDVEARILEVDPPFPRGLGWVGGVPFLRTILRTPIYMASLWRGLKDADVAHIFSASYWSFLVAPVPAWIIARLRGKKTLINYHSGEARDHLQRFRTARPVLRRVDRLVVPSGYLVQVFREFGLNAQAVPNIVDLSQFTYRLRDPLRPHLVCTRGFHPYYCVDAVVRAFAEVQKLYPEARLDLVGKGPLEPQIKDLVREMKLTGLHFPGVVSRQEIGRCYDEADIFINASRLDNMPVSILEAFASGTPVVSTAPEGMRFLVEHERTGLLCEVGDVQGLAANTIRVLRDRELARRLSTNAHQECQKYRWDAVRGQWLDVYRSLASGEER